MQMLLLLVAQAARSTSKNKCNKEGKQGSKEKVMDSALSDERVVDQQLAATGHVLLQLMIDSQRCSCCRQQQTLEYMLLKQVHGVRFVSVYCISIENSTRPEPLI